MYPPEKLLGLAILAGIVCVVIVRYLLAWRSRVSLASTRLSYFSGSDLCLKISATGRSFPFSQQLPYTIGVPLVFIVAKRMSQFVSDGEIEKVPHAHVPL